MRWVIGWAIIQYEYIYSLIEFKEYEVVEIMSQRGQPLGCRDCGVRGVRSVRCVLCVRGSAQTVSQYEYIEPSWTSGLDLV